MIIKNLANILTISRSVGTAALIFVPVLSKEFFVIYILSGITDVLDGFVARVTHTTSKLGAKLDSASDLFFYTVMLHKILPFLKKYLPKLIWIGIYLTLIIRAIIYAYVGFRKKKLISNHTILNKLTGLFAFMLPFVVPTKYFVGYSGLVCAIALIAAIYEFGLVFIKKQEV